MEDKHTNYLTCNHCAPTGLFFTVQNNSLVMSGL